MDYPDYYPMDDLEMNEYAIQLENNFRAKRLNEIYRGDTAESKILHGVVAVRED